MTVSSQQIVADLHAAQIFAQLDEAQLSKLAGIARPLELPPESTIFLQGDPAQAFFLLAEGRVKVFKLLRDGRTATVRHVPAGQTFAEAALFSDSYPSSTETMTASRLYRFETDQVLALLRADPQFAVNMIAAMAHLLGLLNRRVEELLLPVPARLARYLLGLADEQLDRVPGGAGTQTGPRVPGSPPPVVPGGTGGPAALADGPRVVRLPTSKRELAARLGTVPETLSRTFDRLKRAEVIRMSGDHELIEILSFSKLHRLAQD
jgi:CRP-like cAMP-binding protein